MLKLLSSSVLKKKTKKTARIQITLCKNKNYQCKLQLPQWKKRAVHVILGTFAP